MYICIYIYRHTYILSNCSQENWNELLHPMVSTIMNKSKLSISVLAPSPLYGLSLSMVIMIR